MLDSLFGGGGDVETTTTVSPAPWEPDMKLFWDEYVDGFFGTKRPEGIDPNAYYKLNSDGSYQYLGTEKPTETVPFSGSNPFEGRQAPAGTTRDMPGVIKGSDIPEWQGEETPGYKDRLATNNEYLADKSYDYVDTIDALVDDYVSKSEGYTQDYVDKTDTAVGSYTDRMTAAQDKYTKPTLHFKLGGQDLDITPKRNLAALETLGGQYGEMKDTDLSSALSVLQALGGHAAADYDLNRENAATRYAIDQEYTPEKDYFDYMEALSPQAWGAQKLRYGMPQTTETGDASRSPSWVESAGDIIDLGSSAAKLFAMFGGG